MIETKKRKFNPKIESRLAREDLKRLDALASSEGVTRAQKVRDAVLWYLDSEDELKAKKRDSEIARAINDMAKVVVQAINEMTNRICGMLARQGAQVGTLYELTWMGLPDNEEARKAFQSAVNTANQKMRKKLDKDEQSMTEKIKGIVTPWS